MKRTSQNELTPKEWKLGHLKTDSQELVEDHSPALRACTGVPAERLSKVLETAVRHRDAGKTLRNPPEQPELVKAQGIWERH